MERYKFSVRLDDCEVHTCTRKLPSAFDAVFYAKRLQHRLRLRQACNFDNIVIMDEGSNIVGGLLNI